MYVSFVYVSFVYVEHEHDLPLPPFPFSPLLHVPLTPRELLMVKSMDILEPVGTVINLNTISYRTSL